MIFQLICVIVSIVAIIWSFFSPMWAWIPVIIAGTWLYLSLLVIKYRKWRYIDEISPSANEMLQIFGHFYTMPFASRDYSSACSTIQIGAVVVGIVGAISDFWWGLCGTLLFWFVMSKLAFAFNPTVFIQAQPDLLAAHNEVIEWLDFKRNQRTLKDRDQSSEN